MLNIFLFLLFFNYNFDTTYSGEITKKQPKEIIYEKLLSDSLTRSYFYDYFQISSNSAYYSLISKPILHINYSQFFQSKIYYSMHLKIHDEKITYKIRYYNFDEYYHIFNIKLKKNNMDDISNKRKEYYFNEFDKEIKKLIINLENF